MKVLFNRISNKVSGSEVYNVYLLKALRKCDGLSIIFSSNNQELNGRIQSLSIKTIFVDPEVDEIGTKKQFLFAILKLNVYYSRFIKLFKESGLQDIYVFESMTEKIFLTFILQILGKKIVWIEHGPLFKSKAASIIKFLYTFNSYFVKKIICVSEATQIDLLANRIDKQKTITLYIGIDIEDFCPPDKSKIYKSKSKIGWENKKVVGFLGTLNKEKGIEDFIEIATLISNERRDIQFIIVGNGPLLMQIKSEVQKRNLTSRFYFTDYVLDTKKYLSIMDVLLYPSRHQEGLSISLLEAMAMGIPCVATDIGGNKEIVFHQENGILYKNSSFNKVKEQIYSVLNNNKLYKENARDSVINKFSINQNSVMFYKLFKSICHEN